MNGFEESVSHLVSLCAMQLCAVQVIGADGETISLSLDKLKTDFPKHSVITTLQCAGNRRGEMSQVRHVNGLFWGNAAISTAEWSGARLKDVLKIVDAKAGADAVHIEFIGLDCDMAGTMLACLAAGIAPSDHCNVHLIHTHCCFRLDMDLW
jgi:Oxidoreductase molybdopterin binding domain